MKALISGLIVVVLLAAAPDLAAQDKVSDDYNWDYLSLPALTDGQKLKLDDMWLDFLRVAAPLADRRGMLRAERAVLLAAKRPDLESINRKYAEAAGVQDRIQTLWMGFLVEVHKMLKPAQIRWWNFSLLREPNRLLRPLLGGHDEHEWNVAPFFHDQGPRPWEKAPGLPGATPNPNPPPPNP